MQESRTKRKIRCLLTEETSSGAGIEENENEGSPNSKDVWTLFAEKCDVEKENIEKSTRRAWAEIARRVQSDVRRLMKNIEETRK